MKKRFDERSPMSEPATFERCPYGGPDTPSSCCLEKGHVGLHQRHPSVRATMALLVQAAQRTNTPAELDEEEEDE
jgi:hypothetical protein